VLPHRKRPCGGGARKVKKDGVISKKDTFTQGEVSGKRRKVNFAQRKGGLGEKTPTLKQKGQFEETVEKRGKQKKAFPRPSPREEKCHFLEGQAVRRSCLGREQAVEGEGCAKGGGGGKKRGGGEKGKKLKEGIDTFLRGNVNLGLEEGQGPREKKSCKKKTIVSTKKPLLAFQKKKKKEAF